jgi:DNA primase
MAIDFDLFVEWAESRFNDIIVKGNEIKLNSIFCEDSKHHLWCNPSGGKNQSPHGVFHCWKSDETGSLISLVMKVDDCSFEQALETLESTNYRLEDLEKQVQDIFNKKEIVKVVEIENTKLKMPASTYFFDDLPSSNRYKKNAEEYLNKRKISTSGLMICVAGEYKNRIIIPYYNKKGDLIYYNGRYIGENTSLRYLGPPKELGIGKSDVLYVPKWFEHGEILLTEGEFDAITLFQCGLNSAAFGGKELSEAQINLLRPYDPILCLDADNAGGNALIMMGDFLLQKGFDNVSYVRAPKEHKDWNKMYEVCGERIVRAYIKQNKKNYNNFVSVELKNKRLIK